MSGDLWQIWVDTGGTFTGCIALSPLGEKRRVKVLSSGCLRGRILGKVSTGAYHIQQNWGAEQDIFQGYRLGPVNDQSRSAVIQSVDVKNSVLQLVEDIQLTSGLDFEIFSGEEAPLLATRLATLTPLHQPLPNLEIRISSTKESNALLGRKGAKVTLLTTQGFGDLIRIGTQQRPSLFQLAVPEPLFLFDQIIEIPERVSSSGVVLRSLHEEKIGRQLDDVEHEVVAIALLNAYRNPIHEVMLGEELRRRGKKFISLSHAITPTIKLLPRMQTTLVNAYLSPLIFKYLGNIQSKIGEFQTPTNEHQLLVMTSTGGLMNHQAFRPKDGLLSGPAGGVIGAVAVARSLGFDKIITLDMGGASTQSTCYNKRLGYRFVTEINEVEIASPSLDIETIAAGGGSRCYFDGFKLCVGPESTDAYPGPACYGAGGPLTITDVNLLLGKMDPSAMLIPMDVKASRVALKTLQADILDRSGEAISSHEILKGLEKVANQKMAESLRKISAIKGGDPKEFGLLAFGGAGGLHACQIASLLGVTDVILPYDAGFIGAWGLGQARFEKIIERQVNERWEFFTGQMKDLVEQLKIEAIQLLENEMLQVVKTEISAIMLYLRFEGQADCLEVPYDENLSNVANDFEVLYKNLFGYFPEGHVLELERIVVIAASIESVSARVRGSVEEYPAEPDQFLTSVFLKEQKFPVYQWANLEEGAFAEGPAILVNEGSTAFVEEGWRMEVLANQNIVCRLMDPDKFPAEEEKEVLGLELFKNRFAAIAAEMSTQLQRTAFSVNIKDQLDFSCAILDHNAELLVNAPHIPVHLGNLGICAKLVKEKIELKEGDVVITNHPKYGGSHLPDITLISAVFTDEGSLIGYVVNRAHHAELGGSRPGSMPADATTLIEEGVVIAPMYLVKSGVVDWDNLKAILSNAKFPTRALTENLADVKAALAALRVGERRLKKMAGKCGLGKLQYFMNKLKQLSRQALALEIEPLEGRTFKAQEQMDDEHLIAVKIEIKGGRIRFNFEGTSKQHPHNLNANLSIVYSAITYVLRLLCQKNIPLNEGLMDLVDINLPEASFLNPIFFDDPIICPAVFGGNTEVSQRLVDTLLKALRLAACSQGTMNNFVFGNTKFGYYETIGGGIGAVKGQPGRSGTHQHMTNTKITDPEELEWKYPVRLHRFEIRKGSGGVGKWKGGDGIVRELEFLDDVEMTILSQHRKVAPYGMNGGSDGKTGQQYIVRTDGWREYIDGVDNKTMRTGDRVVIKTPGGGGWGRSD